VARVRGSVYWSGLSLRRLSEKKSFH
jgi:hypothetical protein